MRPVVVAAGLLLVVLMSMSASAEWTPKEMCQDKYPPTPCRRNMGEGWYQMGDHRCVKAFFHNAHLTFQDAEQACRRYPNGDLVSIHNIIELCQVECAMYRTTTGKAHYWIGLYRGTQNRFFWSDGSDSTSFSHWARFQPDFMWRMEHCVEMNYWGWGLWNGERCYRKRPYVCAVRV